MKLKLKSTEHIVTAFATPAYGNTAIAIIIKDGDGKLRELWIQPDDQSPQMALLYGYSGMAHRDMTHAVREWVDAKKPRKATT